MTSKLWKHDVLKDVAVILDRLGFESFLGQNLQIGLYVLGKGWYGDLFLELQELIPFLVPGVTSGLLPPLLDLLPLFSGLLKRELSRTFSVRADMDVTFDPLAVAGKRVLPMKY